MDIQEDQTVSLKDEIKNSLCSISKNGKRSIIRIRDTDMTPANENVITKCPNVDGKCLKLKDNDAMSKQILHG